MTKIVVIKAKSLSVFCLCVLCFFSGLISSKIFLNTSNPQGRTPINSRVPKAHVIHLDKKNALGGQTEYSAIDQFNDLGDNLTRLIDLDPENALMRLRALGKAIEPIVAKALFQSWAKKNPDRALEAAQSPENRDIQAIALETVLSTTLEDNPDDIIRLLSSVRKSANSATMASRLFNRWADLDLDGLVTVLATITSPLEHSEAIISIAIKSGKEDPQKALEWISSLPNKTEQQKALSAMVIGWGQTDPKSAALYLDSKHNYEPQLAVALIGIWAKTDPNAAYLWSQNIKDASLRNSAPSQIICSMLTNSTPLKKD